MRPYKNVLLAVDLSEDSRVIGERAKAIAACYDATITLLHVVEYVPIEPMGEALLPTVQIETDLVARARAKLAELAAQIDLPHARQIVETGSIKAVIVRSAQRVDADLIVLGSREGHGLAMLLNFTEDTILHAAPCDVLAVRLH